MRSRSDGRTLGGMGVEMGLGTGNGGLGRWCLRSTPPHPSPHPHRKLFDNARARRRGNCVFQITASVSDYSPIERDSGIGIDIQLAGFLTVSCLRCNSCRRIKKKESPQKVLPFFVTQVSST